MTRAGDQWKRGRDTKKGGSSVEGKVGGRMCPEPAKTREPPVPRQNPARYRMGKNPHQPRQPESAQAKQANPGDERG